MNPRSPIFDIPKPLPNGPDRRIWCASNRFDVFTHIENDAVRHRVKVEFEHANHGPAVIACQTVLIAPRIKEQLEFADAAPAVLVPLWTLTA
jgi:hypothetical protein